MVWWNKRIVLPLRYRNKVQQLKQENIMEKVYVIVKVDVFDCDEEVTIVGTYADKEEAQKKFNSEVKKEKDENPNWNKESEAFDDFIDTDTKFCCWEDGYFCQNHTYITLEEQNVK